MSYLPKTGERFRIVLDRETGKRPHKTNTQKHVCVGRGLDGAVLAKTLDHTGKPYSYTYAWSPTRWEFERVPSPVGFYGRF